MEHLLSEILRRCAADEIVALCVLIRVRGSTPQRAGAKMLVLGNGKTLGTLGGGCVEAEVRSKALEQIAAGVPSHRYDFALDHDYGWDDGLICGGNMDVHVRLLGKLDVAVFENLQAELIAGRPVEFSLPVATAGQTPYVEMLLPSPRLIIAGGGHVGQSLGAMATVLDFQLTVIDDRSDYISPDRFPTAARRILGDIDTELSKICIDAQTYVVIVTRGHRNDGRALAAVVRSAAKYIGLIGSKRKIKTIFDDLAGHGVPVEEIARVHAPIGLEIAAVTPAEIALSIAAELIAVRRGRDGLPAGPMKIDETQLRSWLARPSKSSS